MVIIFAFVSLIVAILIFLMFLVLKRTVGVVNDQTKSYFVNKLQGYDDLILDKENRLNEIDELIKNKEIGLKEEKDKNEKEVYLIDTDIIDLMNSTKYQDNKIYEINKRIDEKFVVNYNELVVDFLTFCREDTDYEFCLKLREKFTSDEIYRFKSLINSDYEREMKNFLNKREYKVYEAFKLILGNNTIDNFIDYLDQLVMLNSPKVTILVGNKSENYDHLGENIETKYNDKIYRGIKIIYKNKVYDFSLSERNI